MADDFFANPPVIKSQGSQFEAASAEARSIDDNLQDFISGNQPIASGDVYGDAFWSAVGPSIAANGSVLDGVGDNFDKINDDLDFTADSYTKANEVNTDLAGNMYT
jgi:hypothetical protein